MQFEQHLPFNFNDDILLDLDNVTEFDDMIYDPKRFAQKEVRRNQKNTSNQNYSTSRITRIPLAKGNVANWNIFELIIQNFLDYYRTQVGAYKRTALTEPYINPVHSRLEIDKRSKKIAWTNLYSVTTDLAPLKPLNVSLGYKKEAFIPNSTSKPWVDKPWQQVDKGALIPPPLRTVAFVTATEKTKRFNDTIIFHVEYQLNRAGYHVIDQDRSMLLTFGPSSEYRKIGIRFCHIDDEFTNIFEGANKFKDSLNYIIIPGQAKATVLSAKDESDKTGLLKDQFRYAFVSDPLNRELFGKNNFHTCLTQVDREINQQLWSEDFKKRIDLATNNLKKQTSTGIFKLFIANVKKAKDTTDDFNLSGMENSICPKCSLNEIYVLFSNVLVTLYGNLNVNTIKEIVGEDFLSQLLWNSLPKQTSLLEEEQVNRSVRMPSMQKANYRLDLLNSSKSIKDFLSSSIFNTFSEARRLSILKSLFNDPKDINVSSYLIDVSDMITKVEQHKHAKRGLTELKKRDLRTITQLHDELSYIIQILDTIPKEIKNHQYDFLEGRTDIPNSPYVIKIPKSNIDIKSWGTRQRHCLSAETEFITESGVKTLSRMVGQTTRVRGSGGRWVDAFIESFGEQPLLKLTIQRGSKSGPVKEIFTTAEHRWFIKDGRRPHGTKVEKTTIDLQEKDRLPSIFGGLPTSVKPSQFGICHGIVFGDGSRFSGNLQPAYVQLCGNKTELQRYFPLSPSRKTKAGIVVSNLPRNWKDLPSLTESVGHLYGWLAGYFAADGCVTTDKEILLSSASLEALQSVRDIAYRIGIGTNPIRTTLRKGYNSEETELYILPFVESTLREDFFLLKKHRDRFLEGHSTTSRDWFVVSLEETDRVEEVFCAVVPDGQAFVLADNILTGNCIGSYADNVLSESRSVIGFWDTEKEKWLGHMSFSPILTPKASPDADGLFDILKDVSLKELAVQQFYGEGNSAIDTNAHTAVINHLQKAIEDWLFCILYASEENKKIIEDDSPLSAMFHERKYFTKITIKGKPKLIEEPNRKISFTNFYLKFLERKNSLDKLKEKSKPYVNNSYNGVVSSTSSNYNSYNVNVSQVIRNIDV